VLLVDKLVEEKAVLARQVAERDATIASLRAVLATLEGTIATLQSSLINHANEAELLRRRLYGTKSERGGTNELQLLLGKVLDDKADLTAKLDALVGENAAGGDGEKPGDTGPGDTPAGPPARPERTTKPTGRRDLSKSRLARMVVTVDDPVSAARGRLIGYDESYQLMRVRAETKVVVLRIARYELTVRGHKTVLAAEAPKTLFPRSLLHGSFIAYLAVQKFLLGVPHYRLEQHLEGTDGELDRGTMSRKMEALGTALASTVVAAMFDDAKTGCQVLSTDATGALIQPGSREGGPKRPCKKGHFFTIVADCDHVLFHYLEHHAQAPVAKLFEGFSGYLQSDASSVYHLLDQGRPVDVEEKKGEVLLVGCWAHYPVLAVIRRRRAPTQGSEGSDMKLAG
jgi:transposase